jgi:hypothetical protein
MCFSIHSRLTSLEEYLSQQENSEDVLSELMMKGMPRNFYYLEYTQQADRCWNK